MTQQQQQPSSQIVTAQSTNPFYASKANGDVNVMTTAAAVTTNNTIDYDFNINAIKTLLMTTKVPESCV